MKKILSAISILGICITSLKAQVIEAPNNYFTMDTSSGCAPLAVTFTNITDTIGQKYTFQWRFSNGENTIWTSNAFDTSMIFTERGTYSIELSIFDTASGFPSYVGNAIASVNLEGISITQPSRSRDTVCAGSEITFWMSGAGNFETDSRFSFGNGNSALFDGESSISYAYPVNGTYTAQYIMVTSQCGIDTVEKTFVVKDSVPPRNVFLFLPDSICPGSSIKISMLDTSNTYSWNFDDGSPTFMGSKVQYAYDSTGKYEVNLDVTSICGGMVTLRDSIHVGNNVKPTLYGIFSVIDSICPGESFVLGINPWNETDSFFVNWRDGSNIEIANDEEVKHAYASTGDYDVQVVVKNLCGNTDTASRVIKIRDDVPISKYEYFDFYLERDSLCPGESFDFYLFDADNDRFTYSWLFGDGSSADGFREFDSDGFASQRHAYTDVGDYTVKMIITNLCDQKDTVEKVLKVSNNVVPELELLSDSLFYCPGDNVPFIIPNAFESVFIDFGDNNSTSNVSIEYVVDGNDTFRIGQVYHTYANLGAYISKITITNSCGKSITDSMIVSINNSVDVETIFEVSDPDSGDTYKLCEDINFIFNLENEGSPIPSTFEWNFGDSTLDTTNNLFTTHTYEVEGDYEVIVKGYNSCGAEDFDTLLISVLGTKCQVIDTIPTDTMPVDTMPIVDTIPTTDTLPTDTGTYIGGIIANSSVMVFPNPSSGSFNIIIEEEEIKYTNTTIIIFNTIGQKLYERRYRTNKMQVNIANLQKGLYTLMINRENGILTKQIMIE